MFIQVTFLFEIYEQMRDFYRKYGLFLLGQSIVKRGLFHVFIHVKIERGGEQIACPLPIPLRLLSFYVFVLNSDLMTGQPKQNYPRWYCCDHILQHKFTHFSSDIWQKLVLAVYQEC